MNILLWIIFGALVGWVASLIMNTDAEQGTILNVAVGIVGALVGGFVMDFFGGSEVTGFNFYSFGVSVLGSVIFLAVVKLIRGTTRGGQRIKV